MSDALAVILIIWLVAYAADQRLQDGLAHWFEQRAAIGCQVTKQ